MKTKLALLLATALVLGTAGGALGKAKPPAKPHKTPVAAKVKKSPAPKGFQAELRGLGISCPTATVSLQGSFGGAGGGFMALVVSKATGKASTLVGKQVALRLLHSTKIQRNGPTIASKLKNGERLDVVALMCSQGLVARNVTAAAKKQ
jgi:hypothetical protein